MVCYGLTTLSLSLIILGMYLDITPLMIVVLMLFQSFHQWGAGSVTGLYSAEICTDTGIVIGSAALQFWIIFNSATMPYLLDDGIFG